MNQFKHAMITRSTVISFETAAKVVGKDELIQFVRRGIVKRIRRSNRFFAYLYRIRFSTSKVSAGICRYDSESISIVFTCIRGMWYVRMKVLMT